MAAYQDFDGYRRQRSHADPLRHQARVRSPTPPITSARSDARNHTPDKQIPARPEAGPAGHQGFKFAVAVVVFHFGVKMLVEFQDILCPFMLAMLCVTVLDPMKQVTLALLENTLLLLFQQVPVCGCCLRGRRPSNGPHNGDEVEVRRGNLTDLMQRLLLCTAIAWTLLLAARSFDLVGHVIWLSTEAVLHDFRYYQQGVQKRQWQLQEILVRYHIQQTPLIDTRHTGEILLNFVRWGAEFISGHVWYTFSELTIMTIFVLFLLYSPVQRDFSPVMKGVFESMETYLKLKTLVSALMGLSTGVALAIIGLELPAAWAILTFLANFVPNIGGPLVALFSCGMGLLDDRKSLSQVAVAGLAQCSIQLIGGSVVEPIIFGTTERIHSIVVVLGLSFFGYIWGLRGMLLSVPLLYAAHAWLETVSKDPSYRTEAREDARFFMGMLEGQWLRAHAGTDLGEGGVSLLTGEITTEMDGVDHSITGTDTLFNRRRSEGEATPSSRPLSKFEEFVALRDARTGGVLLKGLGLRWLLAIAAYWLVLTRGGFELKTLVHPSDTGVSEALLAESTTKTTAPNRTAAPQSLEGCVASVFLGGDSFVVCLAFCPTFTFRS
eukprot:TRINITY_DN24939_c0_g1_i1.p1 TRINITY_DN24939_c0_g1~~TRINITY_DN24939_c0_g1_i1.p1  ORF type:complete len:607 (+),score=88.40 TRINITY_DN24939_c0_g1_i1:101-1921(+)